MISVNLTTLKAVFKACGASTDDFSFFDLLDEEQINKVFNYLHNTLVYYGAPKFGPIQTMCYVFCDLSAREKDWRSHVRGAQAS
jgi:hypothetical protein